MWSWTGQDKVQVTGLWPREHVIDPYWVSNKRTTKLCCRPPLGYSSQVHGVPGLRKTAPSLQTITQDRRHGNLWPTRLSHFRCDFPKIFVSFFKNNKSFGSTSSEFFLFKKKLFLENLMKVWIPIRYKQLHTISAMAIYY